MALMNIRALGVTYADPLFSDLQLTISKADRIGLVAANGSGKSTLLACLAGAMEPTTGDITTARGLRVGHVTQDVPASALTQTFYDWVLASLPAEQAAYESWRVDVILDDLQVPDEVYHARIGELSGGWRRTAMLAGVWVTEPDVLLLDEPTNHLDLRRVTRLENWLAALPHEVPVVLTSHDRAFLDASTNRTLFLRPEVSRVFSLPFSEARAALDEADAADERRHSNDLNKARQLRRQAAKLKNVGINSGSDLLLTKTKQLAKRADTLEAAARPVHQERSAGDIKLSNRDTHAKALIALEDLEVRAPDGRLLYETGKKWILRGDRIVVLGKNGAGKTQLVQLIKRALEEGVERVKATPSVVLGFSDQHLSQLSETETPLSTIVSSFDIGDQRARGVLAGAGIRFQMQDTRVAALSGGQKARLAMLVLRLKSPNFYLLDEPTNHLDIEGQEALEAELIDKEASCLLVSHDRQFLQNVGTRFWQIKGKTLREVDSPDAFLAEETEAS